MKQKHVRDLMIPLADYTTVHEDATLKQAVESLRHSHQKYSTLHYKHRAVLVLDQRGKVVGKLSMHDVLVALEPAYRQMGDMKAVQRAGLSADFIRSMQESFAMWQHPMDDICEKAAAQMVRDVMYTPTAAEHVEADATLDEAVHQLVLGSHQSLLVTDQGEITGVIRLVDVFQAVSDAIAACGETAKDL